ncbi:MAG: CxxxxCH/CxxCH domain-containing protein, partial [Desulfuromonadales bacterium]|nr:CxxxxCH/CxxCH domain-containing protein [Desulfuromonadales bacterium]
VAGSMTSYTAPTCANACHDLAGDGSGAATWLTANSNPLGCNDCHNKAGNALAAPVHAGLSNTSGPASGKHAEHTGAAVAYMGAETCVTCHSHKGELGDFTNTGHADSTMTFAAGLTYTAPTCTNSCHAVAVGRDWTTGTLNCSDCHTQGTLTLGAAGDAAMSASVAPTSGVHTAHMANSNYVANGCTDCHGHSGALNQGADGHVAGPDKSVIGMANEVTSYNGTDNTCANSCHAVVDGRDWTSATTLACNDCHNASGKSLYVSGPVTASVAPATGAHTAHMDNTTYVGTGCTGCHGHSGDLVAAGHVNGPTPATITVANQVTSYNGTDSTCANACHAVVDGRDWTSATVLACDDCHGAAGKTLYRNRVSGSHTAHYNTVPVSGDLGRSGNNSTASYNYGCATCHAGGTHLDGSSRYVSAAVNYSGGAAGTCSTNNCHQDGNSGAPQTVPTWGTPFTGDKCNKCHGNSPTSNAHSVHVVGIHAEDIYSGTTGLLTTATASKSHGDPVTSTTINCNSCHSSVVTSAANALSNSCQSCHSDAGNATIGNAAASIANKMLHVDGTKQVTFALTGFKSKAQLRDDISDVASVTASWSRDNGYKAAGSFDQAKVTVAPAWNGTSCSTVDCHNGQTATWSDNNVSCTYCHTGTPQ